MWLAIAFFLSGIVYTIVQTGLASANNDKKMEMNKAMFGVTVVNAVLVLVLGGCATFYIASNEQAERPYVIFMLHVALLMSVISVSISSLRYVDV
jgi:apolipoprotein N-acyltransferase